MTVTTKPFHDKGISMTDPNPLLATLREPAEVLSQLTPEESRLLFDRLEHVQRAQQRSLDESIDAALAVLPRLMRIPARKILFGR
ncbi:hypothetical protein ACIBCD_15530 [Nocardia brasiliensis]|uniref:hypothetical protein n=1 Tax=Nocardia brasiliensis TaxID=37326 RepID=UPI0037ACC924